MGKRAGRDRKLAETTAPIAPGPAVQVAARRRRLFALWVGVSVLLLVQAAIAAHLGVRRREQRRAGGATLPPSSGPAASVNDAEETPITVRRVAKPRAKTKQTMRAVAGAKTKKKGKQATSEPKPKSEPLPSAQGPVDDVTVPATLSGDASKGARLFSMGCGLCHGRTAKAVSASRYSARQWRAFFARGVHGQYQKLRPHFTRAELADVKTFLISVSGGR